MDAGTSRCLLGLQARTLPHARREKEGAKSQRACRITTKLPVNDFTTHNTAQGHAGSAVCSPENESE